MENRWELNTGWMYENVSDEFQEFPSFITDVSSFLPLDVTSKEKDPEETDSYDS